MKRRDDIVEAPMRRILTSQMCQDEESIHVSAESVFASLVRQSSRGQQLVTMKAPALSTEFAKSTQESKALASKKGSLFEVIFPSKDAISALNKRNHGDKLKFGYVTTAATDAFPGGFGERSAHAIAKEENISQLKGVFPSATLALAKLKARVEARGGNPQALDSIFAKMWGIPEDEVDELPHMHINGSEKTRMAAMEDRAYHALACHPSSNGGFRIDMASIASDAFGSDVPINWQRLRTGMKAVAVVALQGDLSIAEALQKLPNDEQFKFTMDVVEDSQPKYTRPFAWENAVDQLMSVDEGAGFRARRADQDVGSQVMQSVTELLLHQLPDVKPLRIRENVKRISDLVSYTSNCALRRTMEVMALYEADRMLADRDLEEEFDDHAGSQFARSFTVPNNKLTRSTVRSGFAREILGRDRTPDMVSHGSELVRMNRSEFRAAGISNPLSVVGALNLAVYLTVSKFSMAPYAYRLLASVKDPAPGSHGPIVRRLRDPKLYSGSDLVPIGEALFGETFRSTFESAIRNMTLVNDSHHSVVKQELWAYLSSRAGHRRECPVQGGWRDLISYLIENIEGWTLYYWARVSIGKLQYAMSNSILAPIAAGEEVDFLDLLKRGAKERAKRWATQYMEKSKVIEGKLEEERQKGKSKEVKVHRDPSELERREDTRRYIPPHLRKLAHLENLYGDDKDRVTNRTAEEYKRMVEYQTKAKVFKMIEVHTYDRRLSIGISDETMRGMLIEFYQARWYSLHKRIEKAKDRYDDEGNHVPFRLGNWVLTVHPWGEYVKDYPETLSEMLAFTQSLNLRAWTVDPGYIWDKLHKSISELWQDVANEMALISEYLEDVKQCEDDHQADVYLKRRAEKVMGALIGVPAIVIPTPGYTPPFNMPVREIQQVADGNEKHIITSSSAFMHEKPSQVQYDLPQEENVEFEFDLESMLLEADLDEQMMQPIAAPAQLTRYLTHNEIWDALELGKADDVMKRYAMGFRPDVDLDSQYMDGAAGPVLLLPELQKVKIAWKRKLPGIMKRLGHGERLDLISDM